MNNDATPPSTTPGEVPLRWTPDLTRRFWNYYSQFPETYFTEQFGIGILDAVLPLLGTHPKVLDYACGTGSLTGQLLLRDIKVAACDISPASLAKVQQAYGAHPGFLGALQIDEVFQAAPFDAAFLIELVEHVDDPTLLKIFEDVRRILKTWGQVVITTPNEEKLSTDTVYCPCCDHTFHRWQHVRSWSAATLEKFLREQGFEPVALLTTDLSLTPRDGRLRFLAKRLAGKLLKRKPPHLVAVARLIQQQS